MYYSVKVDHNGMAVQYIQCIVEDGNVRSQCGEDEGTDYEDGDGDNDW